MDKDKIRGALEHRFGIVVDNPFSVKPVLNIDTGKVYYIVYFIAAMSPDNYMAILDTHYQINQFATINKKVLEDEKPIAVIELEKTPNVTVQAVWKPSQLSYSPFYPFWQIKDNGKLFYIDAKGARYDQLVTNKKG